MSTLKPRWFHASTLLNSTLYISGGTTKDTSTGQQSILDETLALDFSQSWSIDNPAFTTLPRLTMPLTGHTMNVVPRLKHLLVVGGESEGNQTLVSVLLLDPLSVTTGGGWVIPPELAPSISLTSSFSTTKPTSPVATGKPPTPPAIPPPTNNTQQYLHRTNHAAIATGKDGILLQGGYQTGLTSTAAAAAPAPVNQTIVSSLVTLSPLTKFAPQISAPVSIAPHAPTLARHTMTLTTDGRAIILGGITPQGILANLTSAYVMDTQSATATWKEVPLLGKPPDPRMAFSTVLINSTTLLLFGGTDDFKSAYWVTFYLDLPTWTWSSPTAAGTSPRRWGHTATMVGNTMVVLFGLSSKQVPDTTPVVLLDTTTNTWLTRYTPADQMTGPTTGDPTDQGHKGGPLSLAAVLGIGFVITAGLVIGVFCLLVRRKKRRTRNTLARENMGHHVPRDAIRKQGSDPAWSSFFDRAAIRLGFLRSGSFSSGRSGSRGGGYKPEARRLSAISPQAHPMSIAAQMTQLGHSPASLGYPENVVEHGTGMVPVSSYIYPSQPLTDSETLSAATKTTMRTMRVMTTTPITRRGDTTNDEEDDYGAFVVYHDLSPAQKGALPLSQGKQTMST